MDPKITARIAKKAPCGQCVPPARQPVPRLLKASPDPCSVLIESIFRRPELTCQIGSSPEPAKARAYTTCDGASSEFFI
jgi:hypothetical protein